MREIKLKHNKRAEANGIIVTVLLMIIMIFVAIIIVTRFINSVTPDETWTDEANDTWDDAQANTWFALGFVVLGIIIAAAWFVISLVRGATVNV